MNNNTPLIWILMATYNGERFLPQQLASLSAQSYQNWQLIVGDDGSTDRTLEILTAYAKENERCQIVYNSAGPGGACANFARLFRFAREHGRAEYLMFCDQDDVWKPTKIERTLSAMLATEAGRQDLPVLVYADLELMDAQSEPVAGSLRLKKSVSLPALLSFNYVYGCTIMVNQPMINAVGSIPESAANHDYWLALVASCYTSHYLDEKVIRYRLHNANASGNLIGNNSFRARLKRQLFDPGREIRLFGSLLITQQKFLEIHHKNMSAAQLKLLQGYLRSFRMNRFQTSSVMLSQKIFRSGFFQSLAAFYQVLFFYKRISHFINKEN